MYSAVLTAFMASLLTSPDVNANICGIHVTSASKFITDLLAAPSAKIIYESAEMLSVADERNLRVWSIGKASTGHPIIVCRAVVKGAADFRTELHVLCDAAPQECSRFIERFRS